MIPFLVADRPASLRIVKGSKPYQYRIKTGIMTHAYTSTHFQELIRRYPCSDEPICDVIGEPCLYQQNLDRCEAGRAIRKNTVRMADSGVFTKNGCRLSYSELFECYDNMGVHYGVMIDILKDSKGTALSAEEALREYERRKRRFTLVGVAQGNTLDEYIECYEYLSVLGLQCIAIGGLLQKRKSAKFVAVRDNAFLLTVLDAIRTQFSPKWLFALGCFSPSRIDAFVKRDLWGSDYKGWIFNYLKKSDALVYLSSGRTEYRGIPILNGLSPQAFESASEQEWRFDMVRRHLQFNVYQRIERALGKEASYSISS